ncbi:MAG: thiamine-phosphate kinase [Bacteroidales bacterium]
MEKEGNKTIDSIGEFGLIRRLTEDIAIVQPGTVRGVGDDAAVLDHSGEMTVVTSDLLLEGIHFDLTYTPLKHLGYKSVIVNLSDLYAMNARPRQVVVSLGISSKMSLKAVDELYEGIKLACRDYEVDIVGGDTCASLTGLTISITALGTARKEDLVYRSGAGPGDWIGVTGNLGAAYMGLMLLQRENRLFRQDPGYRPSLSGFEYLIGRQLRPEACRHLGVALAGAGIRPNAMIDLSDGLSSDLIHLCEASGTGCLVEAEWIPVHEETARLSDEMLLSPLVAALNGGEDYELLFTVGEDQGEALRRVTGVTVIGRILPVEEGYGLLLPDGSVAGLEPGGWNAFTGAE